MSHVPPATTVFRTATMLVGVARGLAGHVVAVGAAFVTARMAQPSSSGFEDLAAAVMVFLAMEVAVALACLVYSLRAFVKHRHDLGTGVLAGWAAGAVAVLTYLFGLW
jgi:hypothetical protein